MVCGPVTSSHYMYTFDNGLYSFFGLSTRSRRYRAIDTRRCIIIITSTTVCFFNWLTLAIYFRRLLSCVTFRIRYFFLCILYLYTGGALFGSMSQIITFVMYRSWSDYPGCWSDYVEAATSFCAVLCCFTLGPVLQSSIKLIQDKWNPLSQHFVQQTARL